MSAGGFFTILKRKSLRSRRQTEAPPPAFRPIAVRRFGDAHQNGAQGAHVAVLETRL